MNARDLNTYASAYRRLPFEQHVEQVRRAYLLDFLSESSNLEKRRLLEVGVGRASIFESLPDSWGGAVVEPDGSFLEDALRRIKGVRCEAYNCYLEDFESEEEFDYVVASSVLHEVEDESAFLNQAHRYLKDDGLLVLVVPNASSIHRLIGVEIGILQSTESLSQTNLTMQQKRVYTFQSLERCLSNSRFLKVSAVGLFPKILDHASLADALEKKEIDESFLSQLNSLASRIPTVCSEIFMTAMKVQDA